MTVELAPDEIASWFADVEEEQKKKVELAQPYIDAAAVLSSFDPADIKPFGISLNDREAVTRLLAVSRPLQVAGNRRVRWQLNDGVRREALRGLADRGELRDALAANRDANAPQADRIQTALDLLIGATGPIPLEGGSLDDLIAVQRAANWLADTPARASIDVPELTRRIERERLVKPFHSLADLFVGRDRELAKLSDYVGVLPPESALAHIQRGLRHFSHRLSNVPPLFIHGPGGMGKSALLARFILSHIEGDLAYALPFVYLDFDRATLDPTNPDTLVDEAIRQIGAQFPKVDKVAEIAPAAHERFSSVESVELAKSEHYDLSARLIRQFAAMLNAVATENGQPVLFVLDTFEEAQVQGPTAVELVWMLLERLLNEVKGLRIVVCGRAPLPTRLSHKSVPLTALDIPSTIEFLRRHTRDVPGGPVTEQDAAEIAGLVSIKQEDGQRGAVPLSLALAARIVLRQGLDALKETIPRQGIFSRITTEQQQGLLNTRIMQHLHDSDPDFERIADPGLIVRRITVEVIEKVLADPCGLQLIDRTHAENLYEKLCREVALVDADREAGALWHLASVRRVMLPVLRRKVGRELELKIHEAAIVYYSGEGDGTGPASDRSRAEEIYHRLLAGYPREELEARWRSGLEGRLRSAYEELDGPAKIWLASKLGVEVDDELRLQANLGEWEHQAELRARKLLQNGYADAALDALHEREDRTTASTLPSLEADALTLLGRDGEARSVILSALARASSAGRDDINAGLLSRLATIEERAASGWDEPEHHANEFPERLNTLLKAARRLLSRLTGSGLDEPEDPEVPKDPEQLRKSQLERALNITLEAARSAAVVGDAVAELAANTVALRLHGKLGEEDTPEMLRIEAQIRACIDRPEVRDQLRRRPAVLGEVAAVLGAKIPDLLADALEVLDIDREALEKLLIGLRSTLGRTTNAAADLAQAINLLMSGQKGVIRSGVGRDLAALIRNLREDKDFVQAVSRTFKDRTEANVGRVLEDRLARTLSLLAVLQQEFEELHGYAGMDARPKGSTPDGAASGDLEDPILGEPDGGASSDLQDLYGRIHALAVPRAALCLSGGGIRSASFALGVLQALSRYGLLSDFHYLSTVSGGGYIGSWLSAWRRHAGDDRLVLRSLTTRNADPADEVPELRALRASSNYLTPQKGAMSPDTWTAAALVIRNLVLNWTVFLPLLVAIVLVPIGAAEFVGWSPLWPRPWPQLCLLMAAALLVWALAQSLVSRSGTHGHGIDQGRFLRRILIPQYLAATLLAAVALHPLIGAAARSPGGWLALGAVAGAVIYGVAWWIAFLWRPAAFGRFAVLSTEKDPVPALQLLLYWVVTGAVVGVILALGYELWLATRGAREYTDWIGDPWVKNILVVAGVGWAMFALLFGDNLYVGLASYARDGDSEREWRARSSGWIFAVTLVWIVLSGIVLFGPQALDSLESAWAWKLVAAGGGVSGLVSILTGASAKSAATTARHAIERLPVTVTVSLATLVFLPLLAVLLAGGARHALDAIEQHWWSTDYRYFPDVRLLVTAGACLACFVVAVAMSWFINVNRFSLHAVYRNRLARGFLGSARAARPEADKFTGFDLEDNLPMAELWPPLNGGSRCLFPVINATLNVVATTNLAWQERKAESFSISPLACGNARVGYRPTASYGGPNGGITLGTAMAISGASLSPNQGYNSSPLVSLLMMLGNVRLGWWLGNPRDDRTSAREGPLFSFIPIVNEMFGLTTDTGRYVYLSDGGHFENLGIYEMVRRRCRYIVVSDADCDPNCQLEDLGNAIRKVWIDLGVAIRFRGIGVTARKPEPVDGVYCAIADICYPEPNAKPGLLLYIKPGYHGTEPADVRSYAAMHPAFPHESTAEQWFNESQLETYRVLGSHIVDCICAGGRVSGVEAGGQSDLQLGLPELFVQAQAYLAGSDYGAPDRRAVDDYIGQRQFQGANISGR